MIGENIKRIRESRDLGVNETARKAGISGGYLSAIERGEKLNPSRATLEKIAEALEVSLNYLRGESVRAIVENRLSETGMSFEDLSNKSNVPMAFFDNLEKLIPEEYDYTYINSIASTLDIWPGVLRAALAKQEAPVYTGPTSSAKDDFIDTTIKKEIDKKEIDKKESINQMHTIAAHFEGKKLTPKRMKLIEHYMDALFDDDEE